MTLQQQVSSLDLSKKLKELGVKQESLCYYFRRGKKKGEWQFELAAIGMVDEHESSQDSCEYFSWSHSYDISAFTVAELGEMLPEYADSERMNEKGQRMNGMKKWYCKWEEYSIANYAEYADTEADARALMLIYLIENNLLKL